MLRRHRGHRHRDVGHFDEWAESYDTHWMQRWLVDPLQRQAIDAARRYRPDPMAVLDVGCGTGRLLRRAREAFPGARLVGVDPAPGMIEVARRNAGGDIDFVSGDAESLDAPDESFDLVFTTLSFHHWEDQRAGLRQIHRVMRPGGVFVLSDLVLQWWMQPLAVLVRARARTHTLREFRALLAVAGFSTLSAIPVPRLAHGVYAMAARRTGTVPSAAPTEETEMAGRTSAETA